MPRGATAAVALAFVSWVNADVPLPAFTGAREALRIASRSSLGDRSAVGGLAPKMVSGPQEYIGPQEYLLSLEAVKPSHPLTSANNADGPLWNDKKEAAARFYAFELISQAKQFLHSYLTGPIDRTLLAREFEFEGSSPSGKLSMDSFLAGETVAGATEFYEFSVDKVGSRIWFNARVPLTQEAAQRCSLSFDDEAKVVKFTIQAFKDLSVRQALPAPSVIDRVFELMGGKKSPSPQSWQAPIGYVPAGKSKLATPSKTASEQTTSESANKHSSSPKKWKAPEGYVPGGRPAQIDPLSNAPASKWTKPVGYAPKGNRNVNMEPADLPVSSGSEVRTQSKMESKDSESGIKWEPPNGYAPIADILLDIANFKGGSRTTKKWAPYGGYEPKKDVAISLGSAVMKSESRMEMKTVTPADTEQSSSALMTSAPAKKWEPVGGYEPKKDAAVSLGFHVLTSESKVEMKTVTPAAAEQSSSAPMTSAPGKKWEPVAGYAPNSRPSVPSPAAVPVLKSESKVEMKTATPAAAEQSSSAPMTSAPAKKWVPYGGYDPLSRPSAPSSSAASSGSPVLKSESKVEMKSFTPAASEHSSSAPMTSAPAKKWVPYGGYEPKQDAAVSSGSAVLKSESKVEMKTVTPAAAGQSSSSAAMTSATGKKWEPVAGYAPRKDAAVSSGSAVLKSESKVEMKTVTPAVAEQSSSAPMTSAPGKKWEPVAGYAPNSRPSVPSPAAVPVLKSESKVEMKTATPAAAEQSSSAPMTSAPAKKWVPYGGYDPLSRRSAPSSPAASSGSPVLTSESKVEMKTVTPAAAAGQSSSSAAMTSATGKKWEPVAGYAPRKDAAVSSGSAVLKSESKVEMKTVTPAVAEQSSSAPMTSAPGKKWEPVAGYAPNSRPSVPSPAAVPVLKSESKVEMKTATPAAAEQSSSVPMTSAPAKKWVPYGGYDPLSRPSAPSSSAASSGSPVLTSESKVEMKSFTPAASEHSSSAPMTSAPAKKWVPYGGYEPKQDAAVSSGSAFLTSESKVEMKTATPAVAGQSSSSAAMTSATGKKWEPVAGYAPRKDAAVSSGSAVLKSESKVEMKTVTPAVAEQSSSAPMTSATGKKWEPVAGYAPNSRPSVPSPAAVPVLKSESKVEMKTATPAAAEHSSSAPITSAPAKKWVPYGGYDPLSRRSAPSSSAASSGSPVLTSESKVEMKTATPAAAGQSSLSAAMTSATGKKWEPVAGYAPRKDAAVSSGSAVLKSESKVEMKTVTPAVAEQSSSAPMTSAPGKKWEPVAGYAPNSRPSVPSPAAVPVLKSESKVEMKTATPAAAEQSSSAPMTSAPAKKWVPYGGYEPKQDAAVSSGSPVLTSESKVEMKTATPAAAGQSSLSAAMTSATGKKWEPVAGYAPRKDAAVSSGSAVLKSESKVEMKTVTPAVAEQSSSAPMTSAPGKKWEPVAGYAPNSRPSVPSPAAVPVLKSESKVEMKTATPAAAEQSSSAPMTSAPAKKWVPYGGYEPKQDAAVSSGSPVLTSESKVEMKTATPAAAGQSSLSAAMTSATGKKWEPVAGYAPRKDAAVSSGSAVLKSESKVEMKTVTPAVAEQSSSAPMTSAPGKKWEPVAGYAPNSRPSVPSPAAVPVLKSESKVEMKTATPAAAEQSSSAPMTSAPAKKWVPYGGYDPLSRPSAPSSSAASSGSPVLTSESKVEMKSFTPAASEHSSSAAMTSAPAKKWVPYGGYEPKQDAAVSSGSAVLKSESKVEMKTVTPAAAGQSSSSAAMTSAPGKKWEPVAGYAPRKDAAVSSGSAVLKSESKVEMKTVTPAVAEQSSSAPMTSAPGKKWEPVAGYAPNSRPSAPSPAAVPVLKSESKVEMKTATPAAAEQSSSAPMTSQPPSGYSPKAGKMFYSSAVVSPSGSELRMESKVESKASESGKWQPPVGYVPEGRDRPASPASKEVSASGSELRMELKEESKGSESGKLQPPAGYVPKGGDKSASPSSVVVSSAGLTSGPKVESNGSASTISKAPSKKWAPPAGYIPDGTKTLTRPLQPAQPPQLYRPPEPSRSASAKATAPSSSMPASNKVDMSQEIQRLEAALHSKHDESASKSKTIFRILQNCLALSQTLAAMGEANEKELRQVDVLSSKDGTAEASTRTGRSEELFNVLFNSLVIAQTTVHKAAAVVGVKGTVVPTEKTSTTPKGGGRWW